MNPQNIDYLTERLFFLGFNEVLTGELIKHIGQRLSKFKLPLAIQFPRSTGEKGTVEYSIDFSKGKRDEMYFINFYTARLKGDDPSKERSQLFFIVKGNGTTVFEAFNLLEGRAVYKKMYSQDGEYYFQWQQLDFTRTDHDGNYKINTYHQNYRFDLQRALSEHPIKELGSPTQIRELIAKLHKGSRVPATLIVDETKRPVFLEASPANRRVLVFDEHGNNPR